MKTKIVSLCVALCVLFCGISANAIEITDATGKIIYSDRGETPEYGANFASSFEDILKDQLIEANLVYPDFAEMRVRMEHVAKELRAYKLTPEQKQLDSRWILSIGLSSETQSVAGLEYLQKSSDDARSLINEYQMSIQRDTATNMIIFHRPDYLKKRGDACATKATFIYSAGAPCYVRYKADESLVSYRYPITGKVKNGKIVKSGKKYDPYNEGLMVPLRKNWYLFVEYPPLD